MPASHRRLRAREKALLFDFVLLIDDSRARLLSTCRRCSLIEPPLLWQLPAIAAETLEAAAYKSAPCMERVLVCVDDEETHGVAELPTTLSFSPAPRPPPPSLHPNFNTPTHHHT